MMHQEVVHSLRINAKRINNPLIRPDYRILGATFSPNGKFILSWSSGGTLNLWQANNGNLVGQSMQHEGRSYRNMNNDEGDDFIARMARRDNFADDQLSAVFSADGKRILSWSHDGSARLWNAADGMPVGQPMKHENRVWGATFSPDAQYILSWSEDGTARLWKAEDGTPVGRPMKHEKSVTGATFSVDNRRILSWSKDGTARLWNAADGRPVGQPMNHEKGVRGAVFSIEGNDIFTWSEDHTARIWDANGGDPTFSNDSSDEVLFSPDDKHILFWRNNFLHLRNTSNGQLIGEPMGHKDVDEALFSGDGRRILSHSYNSLQLWDVATCQPAGKPIAHENQRINARFSADSKRVLSWFKDAAYLWDATDGSSIGQPLRHKERVHGANFSDNGLRILTWSGDSVFLWKDDGKFAGKPMDHEKSQSGVFGATFSADRRRILSWGDDNTARLWNAADCGPIGLPMMHKSYVWQSEFSADSLRVLTRSGDSVFLWNAADGKLITKLPNVDSSGQVMFSPNGQDILWHNYDSMRLFRASDGQPIGPFMIRGERVKGAIYSSDGLSIFGWGPKGARLWDTGGHLLGQPYQHESDELDPGVVGEGMSERPAGSLGHSEFNSERQRILTWTYNGSVRLWNVRNHSLISEFRHAKPLTTVILSPKGQRLLTRTEAGITEAGVYRLWDISIDSSVSLDDRILEFEVRSATTLEDDGSVRTLYEAEWADKYKQWEAVLQKQKSKP